MTEEQRQEHCEGHSLPKQARPAGYNGWPVIAFVNVRACRLKLFKGESEFDAVMKDIVRASGLRAHRIFGMRCVAKDGVDASKYVSAPALGQVWLVWNICFLVVAATVCLE